MKPPLTLSIVTPVYNLERYVSQTIESILSQEGDFYIDYIVVDDGSIDSSLEIIKRYASLVQSGKWNTKCLGIEFRYFTGPNRGQTQAYNKGFGVAKGEICAWMNADDYYMPGIFQKVAILYRNNPDVDFFYGDSVKIYEDGRPSTIEPRPRPNETFESLRTRGNSFDLCFFTKKIFEKVGSLDESLQYCVDLDFWFKVFAQAKVLYFPEIIGAFRIRKGSKTTTSQEKFRRERKLLAKKYGGNIIPAKTIFKLRGRIPILNFFQNKTPRLYEIGKKILWRVIDLFKYPEGD